MIDNVPVPELDAVDKEQADRLQRLQEGDWGGPAEEARRAKLDKHRDKMRRLRANARGELGTQVTNATKNDKLHRYYRSVLKGNGPRGGTI